jgi:hypothetical protein
VNFCQIQNLKFWGVTVCDLSINFQFGNVFYCSAFRMVQGEFLGVIEALAYDERISQLDRGKIL